MASDVDSAPAMPAQKFDPAKARAAALVLLAVGCAVFEIARHLPNAQEFGLLGVSALLLLAARCLPISAPRERPLTLMAPLAFALAYWFGAGPAGLGALLACLLYARIGTTGGNTRGWSVGPERLLGARFLVSVSIASWAMRGLGLYPVTYSGLSPALSITSRMFAAGVGDLVFACCLGGGYALLYAPTLVRDGKTANARRHLLRLSGILTLGLLPIALPILLTVPFDSRPFDAQKGAWIGLPLLPLLMLGLRLYRLHHEAHSLRRQLRASEEMGRASVQAPDSVHGMALLEQFLDLSDPLVPSERSLVWVFDPKTNELTPEVARNDLGPFGRLTVLYNEGVIGRVAAQQKPRLVMDAARDPHCLGPDDPDRLPRPLMSGAWLLYPIVMRGQLLGVAQWTRPVNKPFAQADIAHLESLVPQAAIALENVYIRTQMQDLASLDGLTGLWNHRRMYDLLREEMRRATRYHRALCILMMDVDSFKTFNDTYGHPRGDDLLRVVGSVLQNSVRTVDHVGRYGGEEFLIVLPETSKDAACGLAERIRAEIEANAFVVIEGQAIHRTLSIGVASYPEDALNPAELVEQADAAMYRAKRGGKNRVHWA